MDLITTLILSAVEGITEFLPISSTGHLTLTSQILNISQTEFVKSFEIIIQLGAILSVVFLFYKNLLDFKLWPKIIVSFLPAAIIGFTLYKLIKGYLIGNNLITVAALLLGGIFFIIVELFLKNKDVKNIKIEDLSLKRAFGIGVLQAISIIPGVSRAGASIIGGMLFGLKRDEAAKFSFILAVPTMLAATTLDAVETKLNFTSSELMLLAVGFIASFIFALLTVKLFLKYLARHSFIGFGIYRIFVAIAFYLIFLK